MRYVVEGFWTGYTSAQSRVVHRTVVTKGEADKIRQVHKIIYTDGTSLILSVREAEYREKVRTNDTYGHLIWKAARAGQNVFRVGSADDDE